MARVEAGIAGEGDQRRAQPLDQRQQGEEFVGFARVGQRHHHVLGGDHAHVAVAGLGGMDEKGRGARAGQGCGDLAADMAGFADAEHHDAACTGQHQLTGPHEMVVDARGECDNGFGFNRQHPAGEFFQFVVMD